MWLALISFEVAVVSGRCSELFVRERFNDRDGFTDHSLETQPCRSDHEMMAELRTPFVWASLSCYVELCHPGVFSDDPFIYP